MSEEETVAQQADDGDFIHKIESHKANADNRRPHALKKIIEGSQSLQGCTGTFRTLNEEGAVKIEIQEDEA